jgi:hypothetical protein
MERNYDNLTPAQKGKLTRLESKIDAQRSASYQIQWEAYEEKADGLYSIVEKEAERIKQEAQVKIDALRKQITEIDKDRADKIGAIYEQVRKECKPEYEAFTNAQDQARQWYNKKWEAAKEAFWKELGA